jgi:V/A-type H+-transporting ATPase subunit F
MKYYAIGDEDAVLGFGMVGVAGEVVSNAEEAETAFEQALADSDVGIVLITERIAELIRTTVDRYVYTVRFPLIVEIPDRQGRIAGKKGIRELVNESVGIKL